MRPLRLTTLLDVLNKIVMYEKTGILPVVENIRNEKKISKNRMREIIFEFKRMELAHVVTIDGKKIFKSDYLGDKLVNYWKNGASKKMHLILFQKSDPYRYIIDAVEKFGPLEKASLKEILEYKMDIKMTQPVIDNCLQWAELLGVIQFFIGGERKIAYYTLDHEVPYLECIDSIRKFYEDLSEKKGDEIIELNKLREIICFELKISREYFRKNLERYYLEKPKDVYLYSAPPSLDIGGEFRTKIKSISNGTVIYKDYQEGIDICNINRKYIKIVE